MAAASSQADAPRATPVLDTEVLQQHVATLLRVLLQPEAFGLDSQVWYSVSYDDGQLDGRLEHSLAARLDIDPVMLWTAVWPAAFGDRAKAVQISKRLEAARAQADLLEANTTVNKLASFYGSTRVRSPSQPTGRRVEEQEEGKPNMVCHLRPSPPQQVNWISFDATLTSTPVEQLEEGSTLPQPRPLSATRDALERAQRQRSLRSAAASGGVELQLGRQAQQPAQLPREPAQQQSASPKPQRLRSLLAVLGAPKPYRDASGQRLPDSLLDRICESHHWERVKVTKKTETETVRKRREGYVDGLHSVDKCTLSDESNTLLVKLKVGGTNPLQYRTGHHVRLMQCIMLRRTNAGRAHVHASQSLPDSPR